MLSDKILRITTRANVNKKYLLFFSYSDFYREQIENLASGNQDGMRNISQKNLLKVHIPLPKPAEQIEIASVLNDLFEKERHIKEIAENVIKKISLIKECILEKAFRGELNYE